MKKKLLFICGGGFLPRTDGNGNAVLTFGIVNVLLKLGFEVVITPVATRCSKEKLEADKQFLHNHLGIKVVEFSSLISPKRNSLKSITTWMRLCFKNRDLNYFHSTIDAKELLEHLSASDYTHIYGYDWDSVSFFPMLGGKYMKVISLVDLIDIFFESKKKKLFRKISVKTPLEILSWAIGRNKSNVGYQYLKACDLIIEHASQHKNQLCDKGFVNAFYIPHPILSKEEKEEPIKASGKVVISMIGSLKGVSSQLGFYFFVNELYPRIIERIKEIRYDFEFRIIGYGQLPSDLDRRLKQLKYINFLGYVENVEEQYREADLILVTIPVSHGFRTRIAEAFSYRKCVIAHSANADGMPEVENESNALISDNPSELASMIVRAVNSAEVRNEISTKAIATFHSELSVDVASLRYASLLNEIELKNGRS